MEWISKWADAVGAREGERGESGYPIVRVAALMPPKRIRVIAWPRGRPIIRCEPVPRRLPAPLRLLPRPTA